MAGSESGSWHCPLYGREIAEGLCFDINFERLGFVKGNELAVIKRLLGKTRDEVNTACEHCPNWPREDVPAN